MGSFKREIGKKLQAARKAKGFKTQQDLAEKIPGLDRTRISRWESGENIPDPIYQEQLISLLSLSNGFFKESIISVNSSDRASLILEIQSLLNSLDSSQLEMIKSSAQNLLSLNTKNRKQVKD